MTDGRSAPGVRLDVRASADRAERTTTAAEGVSAVNADNPWPGLLAFREADEQYFEGRRTETDDLVRLVRRERLTVFFGLSGLGKSSLLQAGAFPVLRREGVLPVYVRLDFSPVAPDLVAQVKSAIVTQARLAGAEAPAPSPDETLWEYFHRQGTDFWSRRNRPMVPLLAFDQFEEIFTLGRADAARRLASQVLLDHLANLAEGHPPAALKSRLDDDPDASRNFSFTRHPYKLLLSIREDFLAEIEALRERLPSVALNRLRLQRMKGPAALRVVAQADHLIDLPTAVKVVRFVSAGREGMALEHLEVEPALLSVVCRELNEERQRRGEPAITEKLLEGSRDEVLTDFYERTVGDLPVQVRGFIEERLLTKSGFRDSVALENALNLPGVTGDSIDRLVERRLLRREDRGGVQRVELTHDLLTGVVRASRDRRHLQERAEVARAALLEQQERERRLLQEEQKEAERAREKRDLKRTRAALALVLVLALVAAAGLIAALLSYSNLQNANAGAQAAKQEAERQAKVADQQRSVAEQAVNRIQQSLLIRQAALSGDQAKLDELLGRLGSNDAIRYGATATDLRYRSGGYDIYKFELFPLQETLPSGKDAVAFVTYLANHPTFQNTLLTAGQARDFRASYSGWGCLRRIVALTEYVDPARAPTVTVFDMCELLGGAWQRR